MAIVYLGAKRLQGTKLDRVSESLGADVDGTNSGITLINAGTLNYTSNFSSDNYTDAGSRFGVNTSTQKFDFNAVNDTTNDASVYDLGNGNVSDSGWTLRTTFQFSDISYGENCFLYMGISDGNQTEGETSNQNFIGVRLMTPDNATKRYDSVDSLNQSLGQLNQNQYYTFNETDTYYCEIVRTSSTTYTVEIFTGSFGGTSLGKLSSTCSASLTGLRYIKFANRMSGSGSGTYTGTINEVKFFNNKTGDPKLGTGAYSFNGSSSVVEVGGQTTFTEINNPNQISTIVFWYNSSSSPSSTYDKIMGTVDQSASDRGFNIMRTGSSGSGMISLTQAGGNKAVNDLETYTNLFPVDGNWYHYAFKFDDVAGKISIYKDGSLFQEENYASWTPATGGNTQRPFRFGRDESNTKWFNGKIDDCAIYYRGLTATEIETLVNTTVTQGYRGGIGHNASTYTGGGGGGSGSAGNDGVSGTGGNGGNGLASSITGSSLTYGAGGGGGGTGATNGSAGSNTASNYGKGGTGSGSAGNAGVVIVAYTTASGISATGGSIDTSGRSGYKVHTFTSSGTFQITSGSGDVEYLVLGGGAGSGVDNYSGARGFGGGGGGGILTGTKSSMSSGSYTVTIGSAGSAGSGNTNAGNGGNSVFDNLTAYGGGFGSSHYSSTSGGQWGGIGNGGTGGGANNSPSLRGYAIHNTNTGALVSTLSNKAGLKAHYGMNTANGTTASLDDDLSSYADQAAADAKWVSQDTAKSRVNVSDNDIDWRAVNDGSNDAISYDLGSALSNTKWVCRFKMTITNADNSGLAPGADRNQLAVGMFDKDSSEAYNGSSAGIYLQLHLDRDGTDRTYFSRSTGGQLDQLNSRADNFSNTTYYVEIKRTSDANATMTMYSDSGYSTSVLSTPENLTNCSGISDLRYFAIRNSHYNYGSDITGTIDDIKIYDGVTSVSDTFCTNDASTTSDLDSYTNLPVNTIFEQIDDTPTYYWKQSDNTWKLSGDFNPNTISDLKYWLNEKCLSSYSDGDTITSVTSQDDSSTATTVANTPTVTTVNSLKAFKFLKASSEKITANTNFSDSEWTIFAVAKYDSGSANGRVISTNSSSYNWLVGWHGNYVDRAYLGGWINQPTTTSQDLIEYSATSKSGDTKFYREKTLLGSGSTTTAVNGIVIGGDYHTDEFADCTVCELIYYGKILSDSERELVSTYLINKWGVVV